MTRAEEMVYRMAVGDLGIQLPGQSEYYFKASGSGSQITLPITVQPGSIVTVQKNGTWLYEGAGFTISGQIITTTGYSSGDVFRCYYFV